jgi:hypothetical protein
MLKRLVCKPTRVAVLFALMIVGILALRTALATCDGEDPCPSGYYCCTSCGCCVMDGQE